MTPINSAVSTVFWNNPTAPAFRALSTYSAWLAAVNKITGVSRRPPMPRSQSMILKPSEKWLPPCSTSGGNSMSIRMRSGFPWCRALTVPAPSSAVTTSNPSSRRIMDTPRTKTASSSTKSIFFRFTEWWLKHLACLNDVRLIEGRQGDPQPESLACRKSE